MRSSIYDYNTMADAKKIVTAMKKNSKNEREEYVFFKGKKDTFSYWLSWYFGIKFGVIEEEEIKDVNISIITWFNWLFGIELDYIYDEEKNDKPTRMGNIEKQELRQEQTQNEN